MDLGFPSEIYSVIMPFDAQSGSRQVIHQLPLVVLNERQWQNAVPWTSITGLQSNYLDDALCLANDCWEARK